MIVADLPPAEQDRIVCSISAAQTYSIPADIMLAIAEIEGGLPNSKVVNHNKSIDYGYMQFNTAYIKDLSNKYDYNFKELIESEGCYSFYLAAWRISQHIQNDKGSIWQKSANYHSRTPKYNIIYQKRIIVSAKKWAFWLEKNFKTIHLKGVKNEQ